MSRAPAKSRSALRAFLLVALSAVGAVAACTGGPGLVGESGDGADADSGADAAIGPDADAGPDPRTFDPSRYSRDCERDEDCIIVMPIHDCFTCCGYVSVRRGDAERDYAAAQAACQGGGSCAAYCPEARAACFDQICVHLPPDGGLTGP